MAKVTYDYSKALGFISEEEVELIRPQVEAAKELMRDPDISIKDICTRVGYSDPNYFSRIFKKAT